MGSITDIGGVFSSGIASGIKAKKGAKDLAFIYVPQAYATAGVFTRNQFPAACVTYTKRCLSRNVLKAVIINAGNANAGTGEKGLQDTKTMARLTARKLGLRPSEVGVASTGKIGEFLPMDKVESGIEKLLENPQVSEGGVAAEAILTTDLVKKEIVVTRQVGKREIKVAGMAKGSGMIAPNMATTLIFLATNVAIPVGPLQKRLEEAVNKSFNMMSVDTDTSTNDMLLMFSTGTAKDILTLTPEWEALESALLEVCVHLAKAIARDGEGATKLIEVQVICAVSGGDARTIAMNVVNSPLVKTAIHGADPNWGRIIAVACRDPKLKINPAKLSLKLQDHLIFSKGQPVAFDRDAVSVALKGDTVVIALDVGLGNASATSWGCDLTKGYVEINTAYC